MIITFEFKIKYYTYWFLPFPSLLVRQQMAPSACQIFFSADATSIISDLPRLDFFFLAELMV